MNGNSLARQFTGLSQAKDVAKSAAKRRSEKCGEKCSEKRGEKRKNLPLKTVSCLGFITTVFISTGTFHDMR